LVKAWGFSFVTSVHPRREEKIGSSFPTVLRAQHKQSRRRETELNMSEDQSDYDDFVCVDDSGNVVAPNEEASMAVAATFGDELTVHDGTDEWYLEGMRECEEMRARLDALQSGSDESSTDDDEETEENEAPAATDDAEDGTMGPATFSREYSDNGGEDEWVLESLLKRRGTKAVKRDYGEDGNAQVRADYEYLCKWKWYREPTWENRTTLEELGLVSRLEEFDRSRRPINRTTNRRPKRPRKTKKDGAGALELLMGDDFAEKVFVKTRQSGMFVTSYAPVLNQTCEKRFIEKWRLSPASFCPMIMFHGTRSQNIGSIGAHGLRVPNTGNGVRIVNGSSFGVGIYAAKDSAYSRGYTDCDKMFVCLALVGPQYTTMKDCGGICVFFDEALIVPLWLIKFETVDPHKPPTRTSFNLLHYEVNTVPLAGHYANHTNYAAPVPRTQRLTKKMIKQMPRSIKDLYKRGVVHARKTS
jgi:hypothetical protein